MRALIEAEKRLNKDEPPDESDEPGQLACDADYVLDTWLERKLHGLYPEAGGYNDQDPFLMADWRKMTLYYLRAKAGMFSVVPMPPDASNWSDLIGD